MSQVMLSDENFNAALQLAVKQVFQTRGIYCVFQSPPPPLQEIIFYWLIILAYFGWLRHAELMETPRGPDEEEAMIEKMD